MSKKVWRVRAVEEVEVKRFATRLQSALNAMERQGLTITIDQVPVQEALLKGKFVALVTGVGEPLVGGDSSSEDADEESQPAVDAQA